MLKYLTVAFVLVNTAVYAEQTETRCTYKEAEKNCTTVTMSNDEWDQRHSPKVIHVPAALAKEFGR
jgi:hypothetical protein